MKKVLNERNWARYPLTDGDGDGIGDGLARVNGSSLRGMVMVMVMVMVASVYVWFSSLVFDWYIGLGFRCTYITVCPYYS